MKIKFMVIGKTVPAFMATAYDEYAARLKHYCSFETEILTDVKTGKHADSEKLKSEEADKFLKRIDPTDFVVLLDSLGRQFTSEDFSSKISDWESHRRIIFIAGGAFGFGKSLYERADFKLSLSSMTFSHQMVRVIFAEQLYRAFTIIKGEKYHHG